MQVERSKYFLPVLSTDKYINNFLNNNRSTFDKTLSY